MSGQLSLLSKYRDVAPQRCNCLNKRGRCLNSGRSLVLHSNDLRSGQVQCWLKKYCLRLNFMYSADGQLSLLQMNFCQACIMTNKIYQFLLLVESTPNSCTLVRHQNANCQIFLPKSIFYLKELMEMTSQTKYFAQFEILLAENKNKIILF